MISIFFLSNSYTFCENFAVFLVFTNFYFIITEPTSCDYRMKSKREKKIDAASNGKLRNICTVN